MSSYRFDRLNDCITALRSYRSQFYMGVYKNDCGSPACVLGHYQAKYPRRKLITMESEHHFGINAAEWCVLFSCDGCGNAQTRGQAIRYIKKFIREHGGKVTA